jgi:hypothetical protein
MAGKLSVTAYVDVSGPLFDGTAETAAAELTDTIAKRGAEWAREHLAETRMDKSGRATGAFAAALRVVQRNAGFAVPAPMIRGVTWGPWLEGGTKRNKSTKFKGYHLFRDTRQQLEDGVAQEIADKALEEYVPRMGGD